MNNLKKKLSVIAVMFAFMLAFTLIPAANADAAQNTHKYSGADYIINQGKSVQLPNSNIKSFFFGQIIRCMLIHILHTSEQLFIHHD